MTAFVLRAVHATARLVRWRGSLLWLLAALVLAAAGCQSGRLGRVPKGFKDDRESGIAVIGASYTFDSTSLIKANTALHFTLKSNTPFMYNGVPYYSDFRAYVKPKVDVEVVFSSPGDVVVTSGWSYLVGTAPMGRTKRVRAVGAGTKMIIEVDDTETPAVHRVYLVGEATSVALIFVPPDNQSYVLLYPGNYGEIRDADDAPWEDKGLYSENKDRAAFVRMVLGEARSNGVK